MRVLFVQHDHVSPVGPVGAEFAARGFEIEEMLVVPADRFHAPAVTFTFPDPRDYAVIVPMGAIWSVYDEETIGSWVRDELDFLRRAHEEGVPVLGICFGGQALAAALGGSVVSAAESEVGWHPIETAEPDLVDGGPWFQWHHDRWVSPPGARVIARTDRAEQAFALGHSLGLQFHPELTPATLEGWLANGGSAYLEQHGMDVEAVRAQTADLAADAERRARRLVARFLDVVAAPALAQGQAGATPAPGAAH